MPECSKSTTLITGASGRIGRAVHALLSRDREVVGLDRVPSPAADLVGDVGDSSLIRRGLEGVGAVVHSAAIHAPHVGRLPDAEFERVNVEATESLAQLAADAGVEVFVFTSTTALYGGASTPVDAAGWVTETTVPQPRTVYHRTKLEAEARLARIGLTSGMRIVVLRMSRCFPESAPVMAAYRLHRGIDARDVAIGHSLALDRAPRGCTTYILSGETPFEPRDAVMLKADAPRVLRQRARGLTAAFAERGWPLPASIDRVYDASKARSDLGWRSRFGFDEVLRLFSEGSPEVHI